MVDRERIESKRIDLENSIREWGKDWRFKQRVKKVATESYFYKFLGKLALRKKVTTETKKENKETFQGQFISQTLTQ